MGSNISFKIIDNELLKESLLGLQEGNVGNLIIEHLEEFNEYFIAEGLPVYKNKSNNSDYINQIINNKDSFPESIFNTFLCCLFDGFISNINTTTYKHKRNHIVDFYKAIELPNKKLGNSKRKKYNNILERIYEVRPYIKEYGLEMDSNWNLIPKQNLIEKLLHNNYSRYTIVSFLSVIVLITGFNSWNTWKLSKKAERDEDKNFENTIHCYFDSNKKENKILILPFKDINGVNNNEDSGWVISRRLDSLNKADNLGLEIKFCSKLNLIKNEDIYFENLKKQFGADHIIYGFYSNNVTECNSGIKKTKICLNYLANFNLKNLSEVSNSSTENSYGNFKDASLAELNKGYLQENIDFLIYYNAMIAAYNNHKYDETVKYANKIINISNEENKGLIHFYKGLAFNQLFKDDFALIECLQAINFSSKFMSNQFMPNVNVISHKIVADIYFYYNKNERSRFHYIKSFLLIDKIKENLYAVNERLNLHNDNITLSKFLGDGYINKKEKVKFKIWEAISKKKAGFFEEFVNDSISIGKSINNPLLRPPIDFGLMYVKIIRIKQLLLDDNNNKNFKINYPIEDMLKSDSLKVNLCRLKGLSDNMVSQEKTGVAIKILGSHSIWLPLVKMDTCKLDTWQKVYGYDKLFVPDTKFYTYNSDKKNRWSYPK